MNHIDGMDSYPSLAVLIQILVTLPVTTAYQSQLLYQSQKRVEIGRRSKEISFQYC